MIQADNERIKQSTLFQTKNEIPTFVVFYNAGGPILEGEDL